MNVLATVRSYLVRRPPRLDWVQLEVTTRCNASCTYCARDAAGGGWRGQDMPMELLEELLPSLARTGYVHLQGWGEPLLHPSLLDMVGRLREAGCRVGTTSNGLSLDRRLARALVAAGVEVIALSVAGVNAATTDAIRRGAPLARVFEAIRVLREERGARTTPRIHLAYLLLRSGLSSIERLPDLVSEAGVDEVVVSSLSLVMRRELLSEAVLAPDEVELEAVRRRLARVDLEVRQRGVRIHWQLLSPYTAPGRCSENPERSVFVGADGRVHPCVMTGIPVDEQLDSFAWSGVVPRRQLSYGEVGAGGLGALWRGTESRSFRRRLTSADPPVECASCLKRWRVPLESPVDLVPTV